MLIFKVSSSVKLGVFSHELPVPFANEKLDGKTVGGMSALAT